MIKEEIEELRYGIVESNINILDYLEFKDASQVEEWGRKHYSKWAEDYKRNMDIAKSVIKTSYNTSVIEYYCGYSYREINEYLRFDRDKNNLGREMANGLAIILSMSPRIPNNIVAYRLVCDKFIKKIIENNKLGIPTLEKGFISTSLTKDIINSDESYSSHNNLLKVYISKNTVGIYVNGVTKREEQELLLFPNGYFKLIRNPYNEGNKKVYECELFYLKK